MNKSVNKNSGPFLKSFYYAFNGLLHIYKNERNFRFHLLSGALALFLAACLNFSLIEFSLLIIVISIVLITEIINSAIEYTWDKLEPNHHPVVGIIKDVMSSSVLVASLSALAVGLMIVINHLN